MNIPGMGDMMKQMQKMQEDMARNEAELAAIEITGEAGAGLVKIKIKGPTKDCLEVKIDPSLLKEGEDGKEMLEDLLAAAFNKASQDMDRIKEQKLSAVTAGLKMPAGLGSFLK